MKTATRDKYDDDEVDRLVGCSTARLENLWDFARSPLFSYLTVSRKRGEGCGCPTMVRDGWPAATKELETRVRSKEFDGLPRNFHSFCGNWSKMTPDEQRAALAEFARAQRLADELIPGREAP